MLEIIFLITLFLFMATSAISVISWLSEREKYINLTKSLFVLSVVCFIILGIFKLVLFYNGSLINIVSSIWGYFYILSLCIIIITLYIYLRGWRKQFNSYITIISSFISIIMLMSLPFLGSSRKIVFSRDHNSLFSYILPVHIIISFIGEILFFFSFAGSILYLVMEWQLRKKASMKLIYRLPNLETITNFNKWSISRSFIFISLGIAAGMMMDYFAYNTISLGTAKEFHIYFSWIIIFSILVVRRNLKIAPHKASIINAALFVIVMFLFIFTNIFITKGFHSFL